MRPRPDAAENMQDWADYILPTDCFNEAAARCRGKLSWATDGGQERSGFNEAAARCRGKLAELGIQVRYNLLASMRPRPDAAEN